MFYQSNKEKLINHINITFMMNIENKKQIHKYIVNIFTEFSLNSLNNVQVSGTSASHLWKCTRVLSWSLLQIPDTGKWQTIFHNH